jgi:hypothetical protein
MRFYAEATLTRQSPIPEGRVDMTIVQAGTFTEAATKAETEILERNPSSTVLDLKVTPTKGGSSCE